MNTELLDASRLDRAAEILRSGGLVAIPTETVYGLGADGLNERAVARIFEVKGRPQDNPLILHVSDAAELTKWCRDIPAAAWELTERFWPGPLTLVLKRRSVVPLRVTAGLETVAMRCPDHPLTREVLRRAGLPVAAPSANTSGRPSPTKAEHVAEDLDGKIDMIIDGGPVGIGLESTIIDLTEEIPMVLRPGFISLEMLRELLGEVRMDPGLRSADPSFRPKAPGMKYRHYAPKADLTIVEGSQEKVQEAIRRLAREKKAAGEKVGIIATDESAALYEDGIVKSAGSRQNEITIAMHLYSILREFDELKVSVIYSEAFETPQMGQAIMNRLIKAAGHHVIHV